MSIVYVPRIFNVDVEGVTHFPDHIYISSKAKRKIVPVSKLQAMKVHRGNGSKTPPINLSIRCAEFKSALDGCVPLIILKGKEIKNVYTNKISS